MSTRIETKDIQSLVFSGHGRLAQGLAVGLAVRDPVVARAALQELANTEIAFGLSRGVRTHGVQLLLSASGIRTLDGHARNLAAFDTAFQEGIISPQRSRALGDTGRNDPTGWAWHDQTVHAVGLIYAPDDRAARVERERLLGRLAAGWTSVFEMPICLPKDSREPFGFRDGVSTSRVDPGDGSGAGPGVDLLPAGEILLGHSNAEGIVTPPPALGVDGALVVIRQLQQDVQGFWKFWRAQARTDAEAVWLAAKAVGRWPNGMPVRSEAVAPEPAVIEAEVLRALSFTGDRAGQQCPFGAHIRRANPRDSLGVDPERSRQVVSHHRIIRRGRMYGAPAPADWYPTLLGRPELDGPDAQPDGSRGLFFMALCADLGRQFEFIQQTWLNNPKFADLYDEVDPISSGEGIPADSRRFSIPGCPVRRRIQGVEGWITVRGGGYFLLPGRSALVRWLVQS